MKRLFFLSISLLIAITALSSAPQYFDHVKSLYAQGRYNEAIQGFKICLNLYSDELDAEELNSWINKCSESILCKEKEAVERARANAIAAERKAAFEKKQREREEKKLIFVSTNAMTLDADYPAMHSAIKGYLSEAGFKFTDDIESAFWSVYVTAKASEFIFSEEEQVYYSAVNACVKVVNEMTGEIIYEDEIPEIVGYNIFSYAKAVPNAYKKLNKELGKLIVKKIRE